MEAYKNSGKLGTKMDTEFCKAGGRLSEEAEQINAKLLEKQQKLLEEINSAKEEVVQNIKDLKAKKNIKEDNEQGSDGLFNMKNLDSLQELLDQAEETNEMLLFADKKQNVWQIIKRNDIDIADNNAEGEEDAVENNENEENEENEDELVFEGTCN